MPSLKNSNQQVVAHPVFAQHAIEMLETTQLDNLKKEPMALGLLRIVNVTNACAVTAVIQTDSFLTYKF